MRHLTKGIYKFMIGKTAIVTGGGKGIGKSICLAFAKQGVNLVINYSGSEQAAHETKLECEQFGVKCITVRANVSKSEECQELVKQAIDKFETIDILVNNAGITKDNLLMRMSEDEFNDVIDVNLKGTFNMMKSVSRQMMKQRNGRIINIASVVGLMGNAGQANYCASKAGIIGLTKTFAREIASRNVTVNAIAPGFIMSDMTNSLPDDIKQKMLDTIPLKSFGTGEDVAHTAVFLSSEQSKYITGQTLSVDGGMTMR